MIKKTNSRYKMINASTLAKCTAKYIATKYLYYQKRLRRCMPYPQDDITVV